MNPRQKSFLRKSTAIFVAAINLHCQVVMAGAPVWMGLPPGVKPLGLQVRSLFDKTLQLGLTVFHAFPYQQLIDPRGQGDLPQQGQSTPEGVVNREDRQMDILRQMEELEIFRSETFANRPQLPGMQANILD